MPPVSDTAWFYVAAIPAVLLYGLAKGGFSGVSLLAMPIMATVVSPIRAASVLLPVLIVQDTVTLWSYRRQWDRRNVAILLPGALMGTGLAYAFAAAVSDRAMAVLIGVLAVAFAGRGLLQARRGPPPPRPARVLPGVFWGTAIGFSSFFTNAGGPLFQIFVLPQRLSRDLFVGTSSVVFAAVNWLKVVPFLSLGQLTPDSLLQSALLIPAAILSVWAGIWLVRRVPVERFYVIIYTLLFAVGSTLIWRGIA